MKKPWLLFVFILLSALINAQEIDVQGKNVTIPMGSTSPSRNNNTFFGTQVTYAGSVTKTFSITNTGTSDLIVTSVTSNTANFVVSSFPSTTIAPYGSASFDVTYDPAVAATTNGTITVNNNDADEGTYSFRVSGTGLTSRSVRWVNNLGAARPTSVTVNGVSYATINATYTTLQAAISAASSNDIIYVTNGRYKNPNEPSSSNCNYVFGLNPDANLRITFGFSSNLLITSETGDYATSSARLVGYAFSFNYAFQNDITIQGLTLDSIRQNAFYNTNTNNLASYHTKDISILRNKITNVRGHGIKTDSWGGAPYDRGMWEIIGNYFENVGYYQSGVCTGTLNTSAIWLAEAGASCEIRDNIIINPKWAGILCDGFGNINGSINGALSIQGNQIYNTGNAGIQIGWSSTGAAGLLTPVNAIITNNYIENANTSSVTGVGAITMLSSNLAGVKVMNNHVNNSFNGLVVNIAGWVNRPDTADCRFNNFCNMKAGSFAFKHQTGVAPNILGNVSDNSRLYKLRNNYWGASSGPTFSSNPGGTGAAIFKSPTLTSGSVLYSLNNFQLTPFSTSAYTLPITNPGTIQGSTIVCSGVSQTYSVAPVAGATSYTWSLPGGWSGTSNTNTISVTTTTNSGNISVYCVNSCGTTGTSTRSITSSGTPPPAPSGINGPASVCAAATIIFSVSPVAGATSYNWIVPGSWSGSSSTSSISVVTGLTGAGILYASASNSCGTSGNAIKVVTIISPTLSVNSGAVCSGDSFTIVPSGATIYTISGGSTVVTPTALTNYTVTGTGALGCPASNTVVSTVSINPAVNTATARTNVLCFGNSTGAATVTASGGLSPYTYLWSTAQTTSVITSLNAGVRTVTVTDANGCTSTKSVTISQPASALATSTAVSNVSCFGTSTGAATVTASGGTSPYTYLWSTAQTASVITFLNAGARTVTVTDANGCTSSKTVTISQPTSALATSTAVTSALCFGSSTGAATITASGGTSPYTYLWSTAQTTSIITSLNAGARTVTVTDANGCTSTKSVTINQPSAIATSTATASALCNGGNGNATVTATGGTGAYTYMWSSGATTSVITALAGVYTATVTDANGCTDTKSVTISQPSTLVTSSAVTNALCNGGTGSATITASGGTGAYTYLWSSSATTSVVTGLVSGAYSATVTDANGCTSVKSVTISEPTSVTLTLSTSSSTLCSGNTVTLSANGGGGTGLITYTWVSGPVASTYTVNPLVTTGYTANASDANGCSSVASLVLTVATSPTLSINSGSICSGNSFTLSPGGAVTYTYSGGSAVVSPGVTSNFTVTGTAANGCAATPVISTVVVDASPTISVNSGTICFDQSFTITPSGASTYTISGGSSVVSPTINSSYTVTGTSAAGCPASNTVVSSVQVNTLPIISVNSGSICSATSFTILPSGASTYTYQGGSAIVSPTVSSSYTVIGTGANGCVSGAAAVSNVTVFAQPTLNLSGGSICPGNNFTLVPGGASTYTYLNGGPVVTPGSTTSYSVTGTSLEGCPAINTVVAVVTVTNTLVVTITGPSTVCSGQSATLTANGASSYSWTTSDLTNTTVVSPSGVTSYTVYGVSGTCSNNAVATVSVYTTPTISIAGSNTLCSGNNLTLTASGANSYSWSNSASTSSVSVNPTVNISYTATGTTTQGCSASSSIAVTVYSVPVLSVNSGSICSGNSFTINPTGANTYTYSSGAVVTPASTSAYTVTGTSSDGCPALPVVSNVTVNVTPTVSVANGTICEGQSYTINPLGASTYTISGGLSVVSPTITSSYSVNGSSAVGCISSNTAVLSVQVNTLPVISVNSGSICSATSFTIIPSGASTYTYQGGSAIVSPTISSSYTVIGTGANGCVSGAAAVSNVTVFAQPTLNLSGGSICPGNNFTLVPGGASTYTYLNGGPVVTPGSTTSYSVTGTSLEGCPAINTVVAVVTVTNTLLVGVTGNTLICTGETTTLTANGASTYSWSTGAGTASLNLNPLVNTTYTVYGVSGTCSNNAVVSVSVNTTPTIGISGSTTLCVGNSVTLTASGANSYTWNTAATSTSISVSPSVTTTYSVDGTATNGCSSSSLVSVSAFSIPVISVNSGSICSGNSFTITPSGAANYTIQGGSSIISPTSTSSYTVTGTSSQGCQATLSAVSDVTVYVTPTVSVANATICAGQTHTLNPGGADFYTYINGGATVAPATNTSYSVAGSSSLGCVSSNTAVAAITVNTLPAISASSGTICASGSFTIIPTGAASYTISNSGGTVSPVVSPTVTESYTITGTGLNGCSNFTGSIIQVTVFAQPTLALNSGSICPGFNFTLVPTGASTYTYLNGGPVVSPGTSTNYSVAGSSTAGCLAINTATAFVNVVNTLTIGVAGQQSVCSGSSVTLTGSGATTYSWSTGLISNTISLNPNTNTTYTLYGLTPTCSNNAVFTVSVSATPTLNIAGTNTVCAGGTISFTASGATTYSWSTTATNSVVSVSPVANTSYSVTGTAVNGCQSQAIITATVFALPSLTVNNGAICTGQVFTISPAGAISYTYSSGSSTVSPLATTNYSVIGASADGCVSQSVICTVSVSASPTISVNSGSICAGQIFTLTPSGANSYTYSGGSATVSPAGNTSYSITGSSPAGCISSNTAIGTVTVSANPSLTITATSASLCAGLNSTLIVNGATNYSWSTGSGLQSVTVSPSITTTYSVSGSNPDGCSSNASVQVVSNQTPTISVTSPQLSGCKGYSTSLTATGASTYSWSNGAGSASIAVTPTSAINYTVTGRSVEGCSSTAVVSLSVFTNPTVNAGPDLEIGQGANIQVVSTQTGAISYSWTPADYLSGTNILSPFISPQNDIVYVLMGTSSDGCVAYDSLNVKVLKTIFIANYMSPNGDGDNDTWKINLPSLIKDYRVMIVDSYNQTVFEKANNYNNEFDGKRNGDILPDGVYYYFIMEGSTVKYKGSITLTK